MIIKDKENLINKYNEIVKDEYKIDNTTVEELVKEIKDKITIRDYTNGEETQFEISSFYTKSRKAELLVVTYDSGWEYSDKEDDMVKVREETIAF